MRKLFQYLFKKPVTWLADRYSSSPNKEKVFKSLSSLYKSNSNKKTKRICTINFNMEADSFIIFSDQHKGDKGWADDFKGCEQNYISALKYYREQNFSFINLGDSEELWKFKPEVVLPNAKAALQAEAAFQTDKKYYRTFGNHDLLWKNKLDVELLLKDYLQMPQPVMEGIVLRTNIDQHQLDIFLTHGHQGDMMSDNNALSTWLVAHIWMPFQRYLRINVNTPSNDFQLRNKHNKLMYDWSRLKKNLLLITGHTHHPVFASGKYSDHPSNEIVNTDQQHAVKPSYFNTGCCCFSDGDITGIEISGGKIALVKWKLEAGIARKAVLEERLLSQLVKDL